MRYVLAAALLLLAGCTATPEPEESGTPTPSAEPTSEPTSGEVTPERLVRVPALVGTPLRDVRKADLELDLDVTRRPVCAPGVVLEQDPLPGADVAPGSTVSVTVSSYPPAASCISPPARTVARDLQRWARGLDPLPPLADRVRFWVANQPAGSVARAAATDREQWVIDVPYAERFSVRVLDILTAAPMTGARVPPFACLQRTAPPPPELVDRLPRSWTLVTAKSLVEACLQLAAVQVWVDDQRRITDVNVLLGSP